MDAREAEFWADAATRSIWRDLRADVAQEYPFTQDEAMRAVRAAYAQGYVDALVEESPILLDAMMKELALRARLPVP